MQIADVKRRRLRMTTLITSKIWERDEGRGHRLEGRRELCSQSLPKHFNYRRPFRPRWLRKLDPEGFKE